MDSVLGSRDGSQKSRLVNQEGSLQPANILLPKVTVLITDRLSLGHQLQNAFLSVRQSLECTQILICPCTQKRR